MIILVQHGTSSTINKFAMELKPLDSIYITSTKGVLFLSAPPNCAVDPKGLWTVATLIDDNVLITRDKMVVLIPKADVLKAQESHLDLIMDYLKGDKNGKRNSQGHPQGHQ
jgi:hypothetical protein